MKNILSRICIFLPFLVWSQNKNFIPHIVPQAPNVSGLVKYAEVPIDTYNGTTQFGIPIYDLTEGDLNLPLSISYYSNGLKVEEEASWIGLGWTLNAGGIIHHIPRGEDNLNLNIVPLSATATDLNPDPEGNYGDIGDWTTNTIEHGCLFQDDQGNDAYYTTGDIMTFPNKGNQYDLYIYNFAGYTGKYIKDRYGNFIVLDRSNIKFESITDGFKAITPDGNQYVFSTVATNITPIIVPCLPSPGQTNSYTYYLTQIISPTNNTINFSYQENKVKSVPHFSQSVYHSYNPAPSTTRTFSSSINDINEYLLTEINTQNIKIKFTGSTRADVYTNAGPNLYKSKKLDKIEIFKQGTTNAVKTINFNYDYFTGVPNFGDYTAYSTVPTNWGCGYLQPVDNTTSGIDVRRKRLKLLSVIFSGTTVSGSDPKYLFEYNTDLMPYKTSLAQDLWGYFNGIPNASLLPNVNDLGYYDVGVPDYFRQNLEFSIRKSNETYMKAGILIKITQPTGGYTKINYEINDLGFIPGTSTEIALVEKFVHDYNATTTQSLEFTIPDIAGQFQKLDVSLVCNSHVPCTEDDTPNYCPPYSYPYENVHPTDNRLYCLLEKKVGSTWSVVESYSNTTPEIVYEGSLTGTCGIYDKVMDLDPGVYRITANYPDNKVGFLGGPWAEIKMTYYDYPSGPAPANKGAGLRVANIADYDSESLMYNQKKYTYSYPALMTKPIFYKGNSYIELQSISVNPSVCYGAGESPELVQCYAPDVIFNEHVAMLSDAVSPYTFAANGSLVGYAEVTISYGENIIGEPTKYIGTEIYKYKNQMDKRMNYFSELPGIPGAKIFGNGTLTEKITNKILNPGSNGPVLSPVKKELFEYEVKDVRLYWAYKVVSDPPTCVNGANQTNPRYNYFHFYPVKAGKVRLKKKTEINYAISPPLETVTNVTEYQYNAKHQLINERMVNSLDEYIERKTYYPIDLQASGAQQAQMLQLVLENRIDIPIKTENIVADQQISEQVVKYADDATTGNLLLPKEIHEMKGDGDIDVSTDLNRKITFTKYDTDGSIGNGNILEYKQENGANICHIWGYDKTQPVARIENIAYGSIPTGLISAIEIASSSTGTEAGLLTALSNLRTDAALANAMVTTYTYKPLTGVASVTDPKGHTTTYHYDTFGRLLYVKDYEGNILSENLYHYRP